MRSQRRRGLKISEYGIFKGDKKIGGRQEEDIYKTLGMDWIPPELRENRGEIEAALEGKLPKLIELSDIKETSTTTLTGVMVRLPSRRWPSMP